MSTPRVENFKRLGILTYHYAINDGAVLQAYTLLRALASCMEQTKVEIIDYRPFNSELKNLKEALISKKLNTIPSKIRRYVNFSSFVKKRLALSKKRVISNDYRKISARIEGGYDAIIVGSDEIWKVERGSLARPFPNIYWLPQVRGPVKIAFAASANKLKYRELKREQRSWMKDALEEFDLLGVRDKHTAEFLKYVGISDASRITIVPDPTFAFDLEDKMMESRLEKLGVDFKRPRAAVLLTDKKVSREICGYLKSEGYQVSAFSYFNEHADINFYAKLNPEEWAQAFRYFNVCVSDRFHGIIFSLKNKIPVMALDDICDYKEYENKNASLMSEFGLSKYYRDVRKDGFDLRHFKETLKGAIQYAEYSKIRVKLLEKRIDCLSFIEKMRHLIMEK